MQTDIQITEMGERRYGVAVTEGTTTTHHEVTVPYDLFESGIPDAEPEWLVQESIRFLLEREPSTAILDSFSLTDISRHFPEYPEEIERRRAPLAEHEND